MTTTGKLIAVVKSLLEVVGKNEVFLLARFESTYSSKLKLGCKSLGTECLGPL